MKKTYNVISKNTLKLSVMFLFTLFFLGMSSSASAQSTAVTPSVQRAIADPAVDADYSITLKAQIGVSDEVALEILESELRDVREESIKGDLIPQQEAALAARMSFLRKTLSSFTFEKLDLLTSLYLGQQELAVTVSHYNGNMQTLVDADGIAREYVTRLK